MPKEAGEDVGGWGGTSQGRGERGYYGGRAGAAATVEQEQTAREVEAQQARDAQANTISTLLEGFVGLNPALGPIAGAATYGEDIADAIGNEFFGKILGGEGFTGSRTDWEREQAAAAMGGPNNNDPTMGGAPGAAAMRDGGPPDPTLTAALAGDGGETEEEKQAKRYRTYTSPYTGKVYGYQPET